jgi:hypothetical protein
MAYPERPVRQRHGGEQRARPWCAAEQAQTRGAEFQNVPGVNRQHGDGAAQQHGEEVE